MRNIPIMALKDLRLLTRDPFGLFWLLAFPLIFALFFGTIFGGGGGGAGSMRVALVDQDGTEASGIFVAALEDSGAVKLATEIKGRHLDEESAVDSVRRGESTAAIIIPQGFGRGGTLFFSPETPEIRVAIDPARSAEAGFLQGLIARASFERMKTLFTDPASMVPEVKRVRESLAAEADIPEGQRGVLGAFFASMETFLQSVEPAPGGGNGGPAFEPVRVRKLDVARDGSRPASPFEVSFPQAMVWGLIGCAAGFAIALVQERTQGTWLRLRIAPQSRGEILAGKGLSCFATCIAAVFLMLLLGNLFFGVRIASPLHLALALASCGFGFSGLMMLISTLGRTERAVAGAGWAAMMPFAMLGGAMVPLFAMPAWMQDLGSVSPVKWAVLALEGAIWRGLTLQEMLLPCGILIAVGAAGFGLGVAILLRRD